MASISGTLSSPGIGSGLDVTSIVSQLMAVESQPLQNFADEISTDQAKISAWGTLKSALSSLQDAANTFKDPNKVTPLTGAFSDTTFGTASASSPAVPGSYAINVIALASAHKIMSGSFADVTAPLTTVGNQLTVNVGSSSVTIDITSSNNSLQGIRSAINSANVGASATIVNGANGTHQLIITAQQSGLANQISLTGVPELTFNTVTPASDASLTIDGVPVTSSGNVVSGAIDGVTLNLSKEGSTTLNVARDTSAAKTAIDAFVKAYNTLNSSIQASTKYDSSTNKASPLTSNALVRSIQMNVRSALGNSLSTSTGSYSLLSDLGISIDKNGVMSADATKLQKAIDTDPASVNSVLAGYGTKLSNLIDLAVQAGGSIDNSTNSLNAAIKDIGSRRDAFQVRLDALKARYTKQFSALDSIVSGMQSTQSFLSQQLSRL